MVRYHNHMQKKCPSEDIRGNLQLVFKANNIRNSCQFIQTHQSRIHEQINEYQRGHTLCVCVGVGEVRRRTERERQAVLHGKNHHLEIQVTWPKDQLEKKTKTGKLDPRIRIKGSSYPNSNNKKWYNGFDYPKRTQFPTEI